MKKYYLLAFLLFPVTLVAQNKINLNGLHELEAITSKMQSRGAVSDTSVEAIVLLNPGWSEKTLAKYSVKIVTEVSDDIIVASIPADRLTAFSEEKAVKYVEFGNTYNATLYYARPASNVSVVQDGFSFDNTMMRYDGTGVVTGLMDIGIDPNHPMFLDQAGEPRVKVANDYNNNVSATTPDEVKAFTTDNPNETHGTHVAGIMAGRAYAARGFYGLIDNPSGGTTTQKMGQIPYYGVATGSEIVMSGGILSQSNIIKGATAVSDYAKANDKPFVINLSIASCEGPHDGTGAIEQSLARLGRNGIICVATGNDGNKDIFVGKTFTATDKTLNTFIKDNSCGGIDIWGDDDTPLTVTLSIYNAGVLTPIATVSAAGQTASINSQEFKQYMNGSVTLRAEKNILNDRFHVAVSGSFTQKASGRQIVLSVSGSDGHTVYCYGCGNPLTRFTSNSVIGYVNGTTNGSFNSLAAAPNVIAVGAFNSSNSWGTLTGSGYYFINPKSDYPVGEVSCYTGYGRTVKNVGIPQVCAPGSAIVSSLNRYNTKNLSTDELDKKSAKIVGTPMSAYWGSMTGTSMAAPFAAGTIALWLQADPTLKCADVLSIIEKTSVNPLVGNAGADQNEVLRWGAGKLDALAGLKEILSMKSSGLQGAIADDDYLLIEGERVMNISVASAAGITARLYNIQGVVVASARTTGSELVLDASSVAPGVYILTVETATGAPATRRILLR